VNNVLGCTGAYEVKQWGRQTTEFEGGGALLSNMVFRIRRCSSDKGVSGVAYRMMGREVGVGSDVC
jgi:hypothetical protein